jgi:hypothetical protein
MNIIMSHIANQLATEHIKLTPTPLFPPVEWEGLAPPLPLVEVPTLEFPLPKVFLI